MMTSTTGSCEWVWHELLVLTSLTAIHFFLISNVFKTKHLLGQITCLDLHFESRKTIIIIKKNSSKASGWVMFISLFGIKF